MNTQKIKLRGLVQDVQIRKPEEPKFNDHYHYTISVIPIEDPWDDVANLIEGFRKDQTKDNYSGPSFNAYEHKERWDDGCAIRFESIHYPTLKGDLGDLEDHEWHLKFVEVLGEVREHKDGNIYLAFNYVEEVPDLTPSDLEE